MKATFMRAVGHKAGRLFAAGLFIVISIVAAARGPALAEEWAAQKASPVPSNRLSDLPADGGEPDGGVERHSVTLLMRGGDLRL